MEASLLIWFTMAYCYSNQFRLSILVPSKPPTNLRALNKTSPTRIRINWSPLSDSFYLHGILRGYTVVYKPITIANRSILGEEYSERSVIVGPDKLSTELNSLTTFTRYAIRVSAFTVKGNGVRSEPIIAGNTPASGHAHLFTLPDTDASLY